MVSDMSEPLREEQRHHQVDHEQGGQDEADHVLDAHRRSAPFTNSAVTAKKPAVSKTKATSAIGSLQSSRGHSATDQCRAARTLQEAALTRP